MVHSWQPRINCCSTVSPANAVKKKSRMTPFNTTICTQIRLIRDLVTIDQLLKSYLAQERRQLDLQEQYIQSDAQKAQFQSCYACKKWKRYSADKQKQISYHFKNHKQVAIAIMHQSSLFLSISNNITTLRYRDFCALLLYVAYTLQQYTIGSTSIRSNQSVLLRLKKQRRVVNKRC